ncbi:hypothetical protein EJP82_01180 [Paenibacillus anaericanus]|uniref:Lipoprotein n=1 Tax=Paenibacillus anaericanus TaxID=170367 RepID=A0A3S1BVP8_9BACL|nr:hypothetical protein [Paenibacillus anaericanus]RUT48583.1 hypothetical protein EJP82_01180 [Paenibacillus anaericanus]
MKRMVVLLLVLVTSISITACIKGSQKIEKLNNHIPITKSEVVNGNEVDPESSSGENDKGNPADIWTYYNDATWSDEFKGLKSEIIKVVVSDRAPRLDDESIFDASVVGVKFKLENTTEGIFNTYPDQAVLVTSTGEQIDMPEMLVSDHIGGEIEKGVMKEGSVIWYLNRGHAEDITWIKLKWNTIQGDLMGDGEHTKHSVELQLK